MSDGTNLERTAIEVLAERGWARFDSNIGRTDPCCINGALLDASDRLGLALPWEEVGRNTAEVIAEQYPDLADLHFHSIWASAAGTLFRFNDAPGRTVDEVVAVLEKAAIRRDEAVA